MSEKNVTIAEVVLCGVSKYGSARKAFECAKDAAKYINEVVPSKFDSYTCTAINYSSIPTAPLSF